MPDKLTDAEITAIKLSMPNDIIIRKLLAEREAMQAEVKRLRGMMAALTNAAFNSLGWSQAMEAIGQEIHGDYTEQKGGE